MQRQSDLPGIIFHQGWRILIFFTPVLEHFLMHSLVQDCSNRCFYLQAQTKKQVWVPWVNKNFSSFQIYIKWWDVHKLRWNGLTLEYLTFFLSSSKMRTKLLLVLEYFVNAVEFMKLPHCWLWQDICIYWKPFKHCKV